MALCTHIDVKVDADGNNEFAKKVSRIFARKVKSDLHLYDEGIDPQEYITKCVENSIELAKLKVHLGKYMKVDNTDCKVSCIMCMGKFLKNEYKRILPCGHFFHKKCIDTWIFKYNATGCPCCRKQIK